LEERGQGPPPARMIAYGPVRSRGGGTEAPIGVGQISALVERRAPHLQALDDHKVHLKRAPCMDDGTAAPGVPGTQTLSSRDSEPAPSHPEGMPSRVAVIGCGDISPEYFAGCAQHPTLVKVVAAADRDLGRAHAAAERHMLERAATPEDVLSDPDVDIILNLTPPSAHFEVNRAALGADKHVYSEKPLALDREEAATLLGEARSRNLRLGCAPDTVLSGGIQTARKLVDDGWIGTPVAGTAVFSSHGWEHFHPHVDYYYEAGGGPLLDMGPYFITALVHFLGPVRRVAALQRPVAPTRNVPLMGPRSGESLSVSVSTHYAGTLEFQTGALVTLVVSWDLWATHLPYLELYGTEGTLEVPDPDSFGGNPRLRRAGLEELEEPPLPKTDIPWATMPLSHRVDLQRGVGIADLAAGIRSGAPHRCSAELAEHVLDVLISIDESCRHREHVEVTTAPDRPRAMPPSNPGWAVGF
jgi:predicted dehydrogenase